MPETNKPTPEEHVAKLREMTEAQAAAPQRSAPLPIDWTTEGTPSSANGVQVLGSPTQFALLFTDMVPFPGRLSKDGEAGEERARIVGSFRLTPDVYFQIVSAMANNWNKFAIENIDPRMRQPRFKLLDGGEMQLHGIKPPSDEG